MIFPPAVNIWSYGSLTWYHTIPNVSDPKKELQQCIQPLPLQISIAESYLYCLLQIDACRVQYYSKCLYIVWAPRIVFHLTLSSIHTHFNTFKKKSCRKTLLKKVKLLKISNFTFFHNVFYAISLLRSFKSCISVVIYSFFEFWDGLKIVYKGMG